MNSYLDLVAKGLQSDVALLQVHRVVGEVHVAADVKVHPPAEPHHAVAVHPDRLGGVVKLRLPETIHSENCHFIKVSKPDLDHFVDENVRPPELLVVVGDLHEVVGGALGAREARKRRWIGGESGPLLLQPQAAVIPESPGSWLKIWPVSRKCPRERCWLPEADFEGDHHLGVVYLYYVAFHVG